MKAVVDAVGAVYRNVLGSRLVGVAVHGSAITGDALAGLSDIDFAVVLDSPLALADAKAIAARIDRIEIAPFAYVQASYHEAAAPVPTVVPGAFSLLHGGFGQGFIHTAGSLRSAGGSWLGDLPRLVEQDIGDWSVAVARRPRQFRLILTRLKPTVRAHLVISGEDPITTYGSPWPRLCDGLRAYEPSLASDLSTLVRQLGPRDRDLLSLGNGALELLSQFSRPLSG